MKLKAQWRDEIVTVVSVKNGKAQIARACGLRWVKPDELSKPAKADATQALGEERAMEVLG